MPHPVWDPIVRVGDVKEFIRLDKKDLGFGYTATVYDAVDDHLAAKLVEKKTQRLLARDEYYRDVYRQLLTMRHPNVASIHEVVEDPDRYCILMDKCRGPDLVEYVLSFAPGTISESECKRVITQLLLALYHLHSHTLLHRDVKLDNLMFRNKDLRELVLIDFDMCMFLHRRDPPKIMAHPSEVSVVGTREYMAPECYKGQYNTASDIWSCGIILFVLLDGHFPFDVASCQGDTAIRQVLRSGCKFSPKMRQEHPLAVGLIQKMLAFNVESRIQTVHEVLNSAWLNPIEPLWGVPTYSADNRLPWCAFTETDYNDYDTTDTGETSPTSSNGRGSFSDSNVSGNGGFSPQNATTYVIQNPSELASEIQRLAAEGNQLDFGRYDCSTDEDQTCDGCNHVCCPIDRREKVDSIALPGPDPHHMYGVSTIEPDTRSKCRVDEASNIVGL
eukprot:GHVO01051713.1.p1 GENE.GHVO01051713.1~~GHVO01051713.1.p1  ORF type:complete len:460 (-),score=27.33 GHVO01051713.1:477-1811(-)